MVLVEQLESKAKTGIWGLDNILSGGFLRRHLFLVEGMSSGIAELDQLLGGGVEAGSSTLVLGPAGTGKSLTTIVEALGAVQRAISIIKKRTGAHGSTIREYRIDGRGLTIGNPLDAFQGILRGVPVGVGETMPLLRGQGQ